MWNVLVLGGGGRESALAWKLRQSPKCGELFVLPGNGGTEAFKPDEEVKDDDFESIAQFCKDRSIDLVVVGPEQPLIDGISNYLEQKGIAVFGPQSEAAQLEGSKSYAKAFMQRYQIPTASARKFDHSSIIEGMDFIREQEPPVVLKADGLAAGKGVLIEKDIKSALFSFEEMLGGKFGDASNSVLVEQFLDGKEFSVFALTDGQDYRILPVSKDYKRVGEGDKGLNTGGMGAVSPVPFVDEQLMKKVEDRIVRPTIEGLSNEKMDYRGVLFFGLIAVKGEPYVIEYNCRFGDPETEVVLPLIDSDLLSHLMACSKKTLSREVIRLSGRACTTIVLASGGYPGPYEKGKVIDLPSTQEDIVIFQAGTRKDEEKLLTNGGRVMAVTAIADDYKAALKKSYNCIQEISFERMYYRKDIGFDL
ncbi:MAG TPA: phosphoribosylamine--glycine ligase [Saprospiraceae bacterium]|nr:phosphoribosylamine--glycine ligase [Saprospiraceae bacterium]